MSFFKKKEPPALIRQKVPKAMFAEVLWDTCRKYNSILHDLLRPDEQGNCARFTMIKEATIFHLWLCSRVYAAERMMLDALHDHAFRWAAELGKDDFTDFQTTMARRYAEFHSAADGGDLLSVEFIDDFISRMLMGASVPKFGGPQVLVMTREVEFMRALRTDREKYEITQ